MTENLTDGYKTSRQMILTCVTIKTPAEEFLYKRMIGLCCCKVVAHFAWDAQESARAGSRYVYIYKYVWFSSLIFSFKICGIELVCQTQHRFTLISWKTGPGQASTIPLEI